jgi:hypothetical protein
MPALSPDDLFADSGALVRVCAERSRAGHYGIVEFVFGRATLALSCDPDTDEVLLTTREAASTDDLDVDPVLTQLAGKVIESAWWLTNTRGYRDGFQIRFLDLDDRSESTCQFEAAAAALHLRTVAN